MDVDPIYTAEQVKIPPGLSDVLKEYVKQVVRASPQDMRDLLEFSVKYFESRAGRGDNEARAKKMAGLRTAFAAVHAAFSAFDQDQSGNIDRKELQNTWEKLGVSINEEVLEQMFKEADNDDSGQITFKEFVGSVAMWVTVNEAAAQAGAVNNEGEGILKKAFMEVSEAFQIFDVEKQGHIKSIQVGTVLEELGFDVNVTLINKMYRHIDVSSDNTIPFKEFIHALMWLLVKH